MGFLSNLFKKQTKESSAIVLYAPCDGELLPLEKVPDQAFAEKMVGDGVAIDPSGNILAAPCDGVIGKIFKTNHAFSILCDTAEVFVHFGVETVGLEGRGFQRLVEEGAAVTKGTPILQFDLEVLRGIAESVLTPVVVSNAEEFASIQYETSGTLTMGETAIITLEKKSG